MVDNPEVKDALEQLHDEDENIRSQAALSLGWVGDEEVIDPLIDALENDSSPKVRANAAMSLGQLGVDQAIKPLVNSLNDSDYNVRGMAVYSLGLMKSQEAVEPLIEIMRNDPDKETRVAAIEALSQIGDKEAYKPLVYLIVTEENTDILQEAKKSLEKICEIHDITDHEEFIQKIKSEYEDFNKKKLQEQEKEKVKEDMKRSLLEKKRKDQIEIILERLPSMLEYAIHEEVITFDHACQYFDCDEVTLELALEKITNDNFTLKIDSKKKAFMVLKPQSQLSEEAKEKIKLLRMKLGINW